MNLNNWKMIAELRSYIFRWRSRFGRRRLSSLTTWLWTINEYLWLIINIFLLDISGCTNAFQPKHLIKNWMLNCLRKNLNNSSNSPYHLKYISVTSFCFSVFRSCCPGDICSLTPRVMTKCRSLLKAKRLMQQYFACSYNKLASKYSHRKKKAFYLY